MGVRVQRMKLTCCHACTVTKAEVEAAYARLDDELGGEFALNEEAVATLLGLDVSIGVCVTVAWLATRFGGLTCNRNALCSTPGCVRAVCCL